MISEGQEWHDGRGLLICLEHVMRKDDKAGVNEDDPPLRPVCGAVTAYNMKLSYLLSRILKGVWGERKRKKICLNTEEILAYFF